MVALASNNNTEPSGESAKSMPAYCSCMAAQMSCKACVRLLAEHRRHVVEEAAFFLAIGGRLRHTGGKIMHFPVGRNGQVQRIQLSVDEHHPVFARVAVLAARVQVLNGEQFVARQVAHAPRL